MRYRTYIRNDEGKVRIGKRFKTIETVAKYRNNCDEVVTVWDSKQKRWISGPELLYVSILFIEQEE